MYNPKKILLRFFGIIVSGQAYIKVLYLMAGFPLGVFYFVFLVSGLSLGISLLIIWVGIPVLLLVGAGWWLLASLERYMAIYILKEDIPEMVPPSNRGSTLWKRLEIYLANPVTYKSPLYLFLKFPLGISSFVILTTLIFLTVALMSMPFIHYYLPELQVGMFFETGLPAWHIDSMGDYLFCSLAGLILWPLTLHIANALSWVHGKFAKLMLSFEPLGRATLLSKA